MWRDERNIDLLAVEEPPPDYAREAMSLARTVEMPDLTGLGSHDRTAVLAHSVAKALDAG